MIGWQSTIVLTRVLSRIFVNAVDLSADSRSPAARDAFPHSECVVCRSNSGEVRFSRSPPTSSCSHPSEVCIDCLRQVIATAITSGGYVEGISCPSLGCPQRLGYNDIQKWAVSEVFSRYDELLLKDLLRADGRYIACLSCAAGQEHAGGDSSNIVTCYSCGEKQCFRHQVAWHEEYTCEQWDERQREVRNQQQTLTDEWVQTETKACPGPGCGRRIQKIYGCDHLMCKRPGGCGHEFCWQCMAPWKEIISNDNSRHYDGCLYYTGHPGGNPAPPEILAANSTHEPPLPENERPSGFQEVVATGRGLVGQVQGRIRELERRLASLDIELAEETTDATLSEFRALQDLNGDLGFPNSVQTNSHAAGSPAERGDDHYAPALVPILLPSPSQRVAPASSQAVAGPSRETQMRLNSMERLRRAGLPTYLPPPSNPPTRSSEEPREFYPGEFYRRLTHSAATGVMHQSSQSHEPFRAGPYTSSRLQAPASPYQPPAERAQPFSYTTYRFPGNIAAPSPSTYDF